MTGRPGGYARLLEQGTRLCARAQDPLTLLQRLAVVVRRHVPYEAAGWLLVDPDSLLVTAGHSENVSPEQQQALIACELNEPDLNTFADLATSAEPAASLSAATGGDLARSARWRAVYQPAGYGDELRAVFRTSSATWGNVCLTRTADAPGFSGSEVAAVARLCPHVGNAIRVGLALAVAGNGHRTGAPSRPAQVVVVRDDGSVESATAHPDGLRLAVGLEPEPGAAHLAFATHEVAQQTRALAEGGGTGPPPAARVLDPAGQWLLLRGSRLDPDEQGRGRTAVVIEAARSDDLAPLLLQLHELTPREREVTALLLEGRSTRRIAEELCISMDTLRGHVKSVFTKLGVRSRPELSAKLTGSRSPGPS